jgi:chromate transporter
VATVPSLSKPAFSDLTRTFASIGCTSFGGPAGQIALMHRTLVDERQWIDEEDYLHALNFCHLLPGPEAQQLATYIGWKLYGLKGGLVAGMLFIIPGALVILGLSLLYLSASGIGWFAGLLLGLKAAVLAIVAQALIRIAGRALERPFKRVLAAAAFIGLAVFHLPFPFIVLGAGVIGMIVAAKRPEWLGLGSGGAAPVGHDNVQALVGQTIKTVGLWAAIWSIPMIVILATLGTDHILWQIGSFFSQLAVVTFGGAYAVLAYMAQEAVQGFGWLSAGEMADGLGLAETTPGPLILVTQFVGSVAAFRAPDPFSPVVAAIVGAGLTTWVTFAPCFLWIFAFAPWIDRLRSATRLKGGLAAITASVVGVIANLTLWFALHILFTRVTEVHFGPAFVPVPDIASFDLRVAGLAVLAFFLIFALKRGVITTLAICSAGGLLISLV